MCALSNFSLDLIKVPKFPMNEFKRNTFPSWCSSMKQLVNWCFCCSSLLLFITIYYNLRLKVSISDKTGFLPLMADRDKICRFQYYERRRTFDFNLIILFFVPWPDSTCIQVHIENLTVFFAAKYIVTAFKPKICLCFLWMSLTKMTNNLRTNCISYRKWH